MGMGKGAAVRTGPAVLPPLVDLGIEFWMSPVLEWSADQNVHHLRWTGKNGQTYMHDFAWGANGLSIAEMELVKLKVLMSKC